MGNSVGLSIILDNDGTHGVCVDDKSDVSHKDDDDNDDIHGTHRSQ